LNTPVVQTASHVVGTNKKNNYRLDPDFKFLRVVTKDGREIFLALGNIDNGTQVWYSATREVLRLRDGRIAGASGLFTEWRNVVLPEFPSWASLSSLQIAYKWTRVRDVMPGYQYGIRDQLLLHKVAAPKSSELTGISPDTLIWFEEDDTTSQADTLPPARYALDPITHEVVYGDTCLSTTTCFSWQRWPESAQ